MVICPFAPYGLAPGTKTCQICHKLGPDIAERKSFMDLSRTVVVQCHSYLPNGLAHGPKTCQMRQHLGHILGTHICETTGWISTIWSSMELSRPVVEQHHGHLTLTLDFQGQILKMLYLRNGMADGHGIKGMWGNRMLDPCCDFQCPPHPWPWPWIFKFWSNFEKVLSYEWDGWLTWNERNVSQYSIECWTHVVTFNVHLFHDLDIGFSRSNFEKVISQETDGWLTWNERDVNR